MLPSFAKGVLIRFGLGDSEHVTAKVCRDVGIPVKKVVLGAEIDLLSDEALLPLAVESTVFAKLSPSQKQRLVRVLRSTACSNCRAVCKLDMPETACALLAGITPSACSCGDCEWLSRIVGRG